MWTQKTNIQSGSEDVQLVRGIGGGRESVFWKMQRGLASGFAGGAVSFCPEISIFPQFSFVKVYGVLYRNKI